MIIDSKILKRIWFSVMLVTLIITAPHWVNSQAKSNYDAPWVYPALEPNQH